MKKQNLVVLMYITFLSIFTAVFSTLPQDWSQFLFGFGASFVFWICMLAPAFDFEKDSDYSEEGWNEKFNR